MSERRFVDHLPDLIGPEEYAGDPAGRRVRLRIRVTGEGVEVLGDAVRPEALERLLEALGPDAIEQMLCG
jgi:FtsH ternary system-associated peptide